MIEPVLQDNNLTVYNGDAAAVLKQLPDESVQCCVTSPPYFALRSYLPEDNALKEMEIGTEKTPGEFISKLVSIFREVRRVLRTDGTLWVNIGDTMNFGKSRPKGALELVGFCNANTQSRMIIKALGPKQILGIPWRLAFALQDDGWILRQDIIWSKPNPLPESVTDRCTKAHEYLFLLTKTPTYYFDSKAIKEIPSQALLKQISEGYDGKSQKLFEEAKAQDASGTKKRIIAGKRNAILKVRGHDRPHAGFRDKWDGLTKAEQMACGSNKKSVWTISSTPIKENHFATYPPDLIKPCILAGSKAGDTILDPFGGSGTTGQVALEFGRKAILIELNPDYIPIIEQRTDFTPGLKF